MDIFIFRLILAVIGLVGLVVVLLIAANTLDSSAAAAWTRGGAVTLAISGLYALLRTLSQA